MFDPINLSIQDTYTLPITMAMEINTADFEAFIASNKIAFVDCWAPWCGPCRRMGPIIDELSQDLAGKAGVAKLNTDENQGLAMKYRINAIPTILVFKDGQLVNTMVGLQPKENLLDVYERLSE